MLRTKHSLFETDWGQFHSAFISIYDSERPSQLPSPSSLGWFVSVCWQNFAQLQKSVVTFISTLPSCCIAHCWSPDAVCAALHCFSSALTCELPLCVILEPFGYCVRPKQHLKKPQQTLLASRGDLNTTAQLKKNLHVKTEAFIHTGRKYTFLLQIIFLFTHSFSAKYCSGKLNIGSWCYAWCVFWSLAEIEPDWRWRIVVVWELCRKLFFISCMLNVKHEHHSSVSLKIK